MSNRAQLAQLIARIAAYRADAAAARCRASEVNDALTHHGLLQHADQLEQQAEELDVQVAILKGVPPADRDSDVAADVAA